MSLLKLRSKTEPLYTNKNIINYEENINKEITESTKKIKVNSSLIIGEGATIKGEIVEENEITVHGNIEGDIACKDLIVGKTGSIKGKIKADNLYVEGSVEGEIQIKELLKLMSTSYLSGKITYGSLQINEGGKLVGEIEHKDKNIIQEEFKEWNSL
ncbi:polymer-forming cytoskeletal protein [bacterium]|nr:polymer-forming cytoskeletal protein [bacterium]